MFLRVPGNHLFAGVAVHAIEDSDHCKTGRREIKDRNPRPFFWGLLAGVMFCAIGASMTEAGTRTVFISVGSTLGMALLFLTAAVVRMVVDEE